MRVRARAVLRNPLVIILPLVATAWFGWSQYMRAINVPDHASYNLLKNGDFEITGEGNMPSGWEITASNAITYFPERVPGFGGGNGLGVHIDAYKGGSLDVLSPTVPVRADTAYFYKGYHKATAPFWLLVRYYNKDGSSTLKLIKDYGASRQWASNSVALKTDSKTIGLQIVYKMTSKGSLQLDRGFVDQRSTGIYLAANATGAKSVFQNGDAAASDDGTPLGWTPYSEGDNTPDLSYVQHDSQAYLRSQLSSYKDGEAKWVPEPVAVAPGTYMQFSVSYRSNAGAAIIAEYVLEDGSRTFVRISSLPPAAEWTRAEVRTEAPFKAKTLTMNVVLSGNGTLDTDNYSLHDITRQGARHFKRPMVSVTFDEGWQSGYTTAARIMGYLGYKGTFYINPAAIEEEGFITEGQLSRLMKGGHQIASHGNEYVDLTTLNNRQLKRQVQLAHDYVAMQLKLMNIDFAPSGGLDDAAVQAVARTYFRSSRGGDEGLNTKQNFDAYNLKTFYVNRNTTLDRLQHALDEAKQKNGWLILVYHRVEDDFVSKTTVTSKAFGQQMELLQKSGIGVLKVEDAINEAWSD
jgi:peptidoglycan/xylan/chitin deacetylase (PgdA/CDA1 family)